MLVPQRRDCATTQGTKLPRVLWVAVSACCLHPYCLSLMCIFVIRHQLYPFPVAQIFGEYVESFLEGQRLQSAVYGIHLLPPMLHSHILQAYCLHSWAVALPHLLVLFWLSGCATQLCDDQEHLAQPGQGPNPKGWDIF